MNLRIAILAIFIAANTLMIRNAQSTEQIGYAGWSVVNDGVMGGISTSEISLLRNGNAVFQGRVSLENNGGFASVRSARTKLVLSDLDGFLVRVRGDDKTYKLTLRTERSYAVYQKPFTTKNGTWTEHLLNLEDFIPSFRGRILSNAPALNTGTEVIIGFIISDKQSGPFRLESKPIQPLLTPNSQIGSPTLTSGRVDD